MLLSQLTYRHSNCYSRFVTSKEAAFDDVGASTGEQGWYLLIHQLPPRPLYLRARIRQRLDRVGAVALKNSVYILPLVASCREDLERLAHEAVAGGGEAFVCQSRFVFGLEAAALQERFRRSRAADYDELVASAKEALTWLRRAGEARDQDPGSRLRRLKRRLQEVIAIDFFGAPRRSQAEAAVRALEARLQPAKKPAPGLRGDSRAALVGKTWVTRKGVHVDRIASAWLVRRFVDPAARFRFVDSREPAVAGEIRFDMVDGDFTHRGEHCTFEDLVSHLGLRDAALLEVAEIVHDIDLKDGKFARSEASGLEQLVVGICRAQAGDEARFERGFELFDDLYRAYSAPGELQAPLPKRSARTGGKT